MEMGIEDGGWGWRLEHESGDEDGRVGVDDKNEGWSVRM